LWRSTAYKVVVTAAMPLAKSKPIPAPSGRAKLLLGDVLFGLP